MLLVVIYLNFARLTEFHLLPLPTCIISYCSKIQNALTWHKLTQVVQYQAVGSRLPRYAPAPVSTARCSPAPAHTRLTPETAAPSTPCFQ